MSNKTGSKLRRAVKEALTDLSNIQSIEGMKRHLQLNTYPVLSMFADASASQEELVDEIGSAVAEHETQLEAIVNEDGEVESGTEPDLADRLIRHLTEFQALIANMKGMTDLPDDQLPEMMREGKADAASRFNELLAENVALIGAVKDSRFEEEEEGEVVHLVPKDGGPAPSAEASEEAGDGNE